MKNIILTLAAVSILLAGCKPQKSQDEKPEHKQEEKGIKVKVEKVAVQSFKHFVEASGVADAVQSAMISPQVSGQVKKVVVNEGDHVQEGQTLVVLNDVMIRNNIAQVKAQLALARSTYEKQKALYEQKITSEIAYLQAKAQKEALENQLANLQEQLSYTEVKAPFDGIVENIQIKEGEIAAPGRILMQLVNLDNMKIITDISEKYIAKLNKKDTAIITFDNLDLQPVRLTPWRIGNIINPSNRTFKVEFRLKNPGHQIKPNLTCRIRIADYENDSSILVPIILVKKDFDRLFVFVVKKDNGVPVAKKQYVETGLTYKDKTEIVDGLKPGDLLITEGYNEVSDNSPVEIIN